MGTPEFAVPTLEALDDAQDIVGVVTQPDRPRGRGRKLRPSPVKRVALERELPLFQPKTLRKPDSVAQLASWEPDVIVVAAFGQILTIEVLDLPPHGSINVHASLLPRWRGAAPVAAAIMAGDEITGVTIMRMDEGLDTGPILTQREEPILPHDTRASLSERLSTIGAELLIETLPSYLAGDIEPRPQDPERASYANQLRKAEGRLDWSRPAVELERKIRALTPWPGTFTTLNGKRFKVLDGSVMPEWSGEAPPGTIVAVDGGVAVATGEGALRLEKVQLAGKRPMEIQAFLCGHRECVDARLGEKER